MEKSIVLDENKSHIISLDGEESPVVLLVWDHRAGNLACFVAVFVCLAQGSLTVRNTRTQTCCHVSVTRWAAGAVHEHQTCLCSLKGRREALFSSGNGFER